MPAAARAPLGRPLGPVRRILATTSPEMLTNADFSSGVAGWLGHPFDVQGNHAIDAATYHSPPYAVRVDVQAVLPPGSYKLWQAPLEVRQHEAYTLRFWARGTPGQRLVMHLYGEQCPSMFCLQGRKFCVSEEWTLFETSFRSSGTASVGLDLFVTEPGTVWLDDVSLRTGDTTLFRRDFENGIVLLNYTHQAQAVDLESTYYRLAIPESAVFDGAAVDRESVPPYDARILLREPPAPLPRPEPTDTPPPGALQAFLSQNEPNPFNPATRIRFRLSTNEKVHLGVYDVAGRLLRVLVDRELAGGVDHEIAWDGRDASGRPLPSGIYLYRITTASFTQSRKTVLAR